MNHSSKAIEIEDVEFLVAELERVGEVQEEETLRPVNLRPPEFRIGISRNCYPITLANATSSQSAVIRMATIGSKSGPVRRRLNEDDGKLPLFGVLVPARDGQPSLGGLPR